MNELDDLFLGLLDAYERAETTVIWEYSGTIAKDEVELAADIADYRARYEKITGRTLEQTQREA